METNVTNGRFGFRTFSKCGHEVLPKCGKPGCKFFESFWEPVWDNYSENNGSVFCLHSPDYPFTTFPPIICILINVSKVSLFRSSSFLGVLWEANMLFEKGHVWGIWKKSKCENTTYFPQIMVHTNFERTFKRIVFNRNILFLECSKKD